MWRSRLSRARDGSLRVGGRARCGVLDGAWSRSWASRKHRHFAVFRSNCRSFDCVDRMRGQLHLRMTAIRDSEVPEPWATWRLSIVEATTGSSRREDLGSCDRRNGRAGLWFPTQATKTNDVAWMGHRLRENTTYRERRCRYPRSPKSGDLGHPALLECEESPRAEKDWASFKSSGVSSGLV
jgi:hypothetical protein